MKLHVRELRRGDEYALRKVFYSSVHELACKDYTPEQLAAWAPEAYEVGPWAERIRSTPPFIVDASGAVAGFAVLLEDAPYGHALRLRKIFRVTVAQASDVRRPVQIPKAPHIRLVRTPFPTPATLH